jgi:hypothetical protein
MRADCEGLMSAGRKVETGHAKEGELEKPEIRTGGVRETDLVNQGGLRTPFGAQLRCCAMRRRAYDGDDMIWIRMAILGPEGG